MGQKTSPLILRKGFNIIERSQYFFGRSGNFFLTQEMSMRLNLKKFFRLYKSKLDPLMVLTNDKKIQLFLYFNLKKTRYKRIRFKHKVRHRRLNKIRKKLWKKKRKKMFAVRRTQLRARIFKNRTNLLFYKDFWNTQFQLKLTRFQWIFTLFTGLRPRCLESLLRKTQTTSLLTGILKNSNLKKTLVKRLLRKYLAIRNQAAIQHTFIIFFLSKLITYLKILQPNSLNLTGIQQQLKQFFRVATIPLSSHFQTRFHKLTYGTQSQILKTPNLSRFFIAKFFYFRKSSKRNQQQLHFLHKTAKVSPTILKSLNAYRQIFPIQNQSTQKLKRLLFSKMIYRQKDKKAQRLNRNYKRFTRVAKLNYKVSRIRIQKRFRHFRLFHNRKRFAVFAGLSIYPSLKGRHTSKEHLLFRWFKNFYTTPKPRVRDKARPYLLAYSKKLLKSPYYLKHQQRLNRYIRRQRLLKKRKLTKNERNLIYLERYDDLYQIFKNKRLKKKRWPSWRRRSWFKRRRPLRIQQSPRRKRNKRRSLKKKFRKAICQQYKTAKQYNFNFVKYYTLQFSKRLLATPVLSYKLEKLTYKKKAPQHLKYKKFRRILNKIRTPLYTLKKFRQKRLRYKSRKRALRHLRKKFNVFRVCYFLYFFNRPMYAAALAPMLPVRKIIKKKKISKLKQRRKRSLRRRKTLRVLNNRKCKRLHLVRFKRRIKLLNLWKRSLRKQKFMQAQSPFYAPKKRLQRRYHLVDPYNMCNTTLQVKSQLLRVTPQSAQYLIDSFHFWTTCFFKTKHASQSTLKYSLSIFTENPQQRRMIKTFLNKKVLYFRTLVTHYTQFLKKKKYLSILFYKKLLKKILQNRLTQTPNDLFKQSK